jgi:hypothetical protein
LCNLVYFSHVLTNLNHMKIRILLLFLICSISFQKVSQAQVPANDLCINAIMLNCDTIVSGTTLLATVDSLPNCVTTAATAPSVWYTFVGTGDAVTASLCGTASFDSQIAVYTGSCGSFTCVVGNDDASGCALTSEVMFNSLLGTTYFIVIEGYGIASGTFDLEITCSAPCVPVPSNDLCSGASPLTVYGSAALCTPTLGTNLCATQNLINPPCFMFGNVYDIWYTFTTGSTFGVTLDLDSLTGGDFFVAIYESCSAASIYCSATDGFSSLNIGGLDTNTTYFLQVFNGGGSLFGTFNICIAADSTVPAPPVPGPNDECSGSILLTMQTTCVPLASNVLAATQSFPADSCNGYLSPGALDVWYSFVATDTIGTIEVNPMFDPVVELLDTCIAAGNTLGCSDEVGVVDEAITYNNFIIGNTYYIRVFNYGGAAPADPTFNICVYAGDFVSVGEIEKSPFNIFPNPSQGLINIEYSSRITGKVFITNGVGQRVKSIELSKSIDLSMFEKGIYHLTIVDNNGTMLKTQRIILQ